MPSGKHDVYLLAVSLMLLHAVACFLQATLATLTDLIATPNLIWEPSTRGWGNSRGEYCKSWIQLVGRHAV